YSTIIYKSRTEMEKLVACVQRRPNALFRLICFPWAGGGTSQLAQWGKLFDDSIEVFCIRLPGRESRHEEPFAKDMTSVVNEVTSVLLKEFKEKPFAFFAHSFGTYTSLAVALHLKEKYGLEPVHLFLSSAHAPNVSYGIINIMKQNHKLGTNSKSDILQYAMESSFNIKLTFLQNLWSEKCSDVDAEYIIFTKTEKNIPFSCDVTYFYGSDDKIYDSQGWRELTCGDISFYQLPGDHFYLLKPSNESFLIKHITRCIENAGL
uniref:oleoyl-[acyl-carrier-protein] hydrolase n=1 Tax=Zosterops lateralis melanops TaxID=1220523 RepID=A0A8D2NPI6_ZOSLA